MFFQGRRQFRAPSACLQQPNTSWLIVTYKEVIKKEPPKARWALVHVLHGCWSPPSSFERFDLHLSGGGGYDEDGNYNDDGDRVTGLGVVLHLFCSGQDGMDIWNGVILQGDRRQIQQPFMLVGIHSEIA